MKQLFFRTETILMVVTILVFLFTNFLLQIPYQNNNCVDCGNYLESIDFLFNKFETHYYRPIGMAILYGWPLFFNNLKLQNVLTLVPYLNLMFFLGVVLVYFNISKLFFSKKTALYISFSFVFLFGIIARNHQLLSEIPLLFFSGLAFYLLAKHYQNFNVKYLFLSLSTMLFCILIRPGFMFFALLMFCFHIKTITNNIISKYSFIFFIPLVLLGFQLIKMKEKYGNYTFSYIDATTYYNYLGSKAICFKNNTTLNQNHNKRADYMYKLPFNETKRVAIIDFKTQISNNKPFLVKAYIHDIEENTKTGSSAIKIFKNNQNHTNFNFWQLFFNETSEWQNKLLTLFGLLTSTFYLINFRKTKKIIIIFSLYFYYVFFISGISSTQGDRFHIVFYPMVIVLVTHFLQKEQFFSKIVKKLL